jgi:hypothetical protein
VDRIMLRRHRVQIRSGCSIALTRTRTTRSAGMNS